MKEIYFIMALSASFAINIFLAIYYTQRRKSVKKAWFRKGIQHAFVSFEERMKLGRIQDRKLKSLFEVMKKDSLKEYNKL